MSKGNQTAANSQYWRNQILNWESGAYFKEGAAKASFWDKVSRYFRGDGMYVRMNAALEEVAPFIKGKIVLDVGCGSGRFAFALAEAGAKKVIGIDVAPEAIALANEQRRESPLASKLEFTTVDVTKGTAKLPKADIATALGVIEYFDEPTLAKFLGKLNAPYFFIDFPDSLGRTRNPLTWQLRQVYLWIKHVPGVFLYSQDQFRSLAKKHGFSNLWYVRHASFDYVSNLPKTSKKSKK